MLGATGRNIETVSSISGPNLDQVMVNLFQIVIFHMLICPKESLSHLKVEIIQNMWLNRRKRETRNIRKQKLKLFKRKSLKKLLRSKKPNL